MKYFLFSLCALSMASGCASFSTTPLTRDDSNSISGDSNGSPRHWHCRTRPFRGIPVKVKVQTHVDVFIEEQYVLWKGEKFETWREKSLPNKFYSVRADPVMSDQIVITDFKRPASGVLDLKVDFTEDQYFKKIESTVQDTTITDSAALLSTIITKFGPAGLTDQGDQSAYADRWQWKKRVVAYQRFDINAPDFEQQVDHFVSQYLNDCNRGRCEAGPSYDEHAGLHGTAQPMQP